MPVSEAKKQAIKRYTDKFETITIRTDTKTKDCLKEYVDKRNTSINVVLNKHIKQLLKRECK